MISGDVTAFGARGDGSHDDTAAVLGTIEAVRRAGGGEVVFPSGSYRVTGSVPAYSRITFRGAGMALSTLQFHGRQVNGFIDGEGTTADHPMTDTGWRDLGLDGSAISAGPAKGIYVQHMLRPRWQDVLVRGFPSTGFGADFLLDGVFARCRAEGNGRLENVDDPGGAGIGIGVGASSDEHVLVVACSCVDNRTWGVFFELQQGSSPGRRSIGSRVVQSYLARNGFGVGDAGLTGLEVSDCTIVGNAYDGVTVNHGSGQGLGTPGQGGLIAENVIVRNRRHGIWLDYADAADDRPGGYIVRDNLVAGTGGSGILVSSGRRRVRDISLIGNDLVGCAEPGVCCAAGGGLSDLVVQDNRARSNGNAPRQAQIRLSGPMVRPRVVDNIAYGDAGTDVGIDLGEVDSQDALVTGNDVRGAGAGIALGPRLAGRSWVERNPGHDPPPPMPLAPDTAPLIHTARVRPEDVYVSGGSQVVTRLAGEVLFTGSGAVRLNPGETLTVSWEAPPRVVVRKL